MKDSKTLLAVAVLLALCCGSDQRRTTPFPLTKQLEPAGKFQIDQT